MQDVVIDVTVTGIRPLLQNKYTEEETNIKKGKVYEDKDETDKRILKDKNGNICQPAEHFESSMIKSAVDYKFSGHKTYKELFKAGVFVDPLMPVHKNPKYETYKTLVKIGAARVPRCRPMFNDWEVDFTITIRDDRIEPLVVKQILQNAGKYYGVGDRRPRYGLFDVTKFEIRNGVKKLKK